MGFKEKMQYRTAQAYLEKYGDRITQIQGNVVSVKIEEKSVLWMLHKVNLILLVRPDRSKSVVQCVYKKKKWFKKVPLIPINQGNLVIVQGLKGKKGKDNREIVKIINVLNQTNKKELVKINADMKKSAQKIKRVK